MCVVPIKLRCRQTNKSISTFALLDNCSQGTFVDDSLLKKMGATGPTTSITVSTINGDKQITSKIIKNLEVTSQHGDTWISLDKCMSQQSLTVTVDEVPTQKSIEPWEYLHRIKDELSPSNMVTIGILIGADCKKALEPIEVIQSQGDGPFAYKTRLGWCVVGSLNKFNHPLKGLQCHRIVVNNTHPTSIHCFATMKPTKDLGVAEMLKKIYTDDFTEHQSPSANQTVPTRTFHITI